MLTCGAWVCARMRVWLAHGQPSNARVTACDTAGLSDEQLAILLQDELFLRELQSHPDFAQVISSAVIVIHVCVCVCACVRVCVCACAHFDRHVSLSCWMRRPKLPTPGAPCCLLVLCFLGKDAARGVPGGASAVGLRTRGSKRRQASGGRQTFAAQPALRAQRRRRRQQRWRRAGGAVVDGASQGLRGRLHAAAATGGRVSWGGAGMLLPDLVQVFA